MVFVRVLVAVMSGVGGHEQVVSRLVHRGNEEIRPSGKKNKDTVHAKFEETERLGSTGYSE